MRHWGELEEFPAAGKRPSGNGEGRRRLGEPWGDDIDGNPVAP